MSQLNSVNSSNFRMSNGIAGGFDPPPYTDFVPQTRDSYELIHAAMQYDNFKPVMQETSFIETPPTYEQSSEAVEGLTAAEEAETSLATAGEAGLMEGIASPLAAIGAVKVTGDMASNSISNMLSTQFSNVNIQNTQAHGLDATRQVNMVNEANQQSLGNANFGMNIGSWFGPIGSYLGYAFSNTNVASSLNMNTGYSTNGMVNPELYDSVATSYASTEASDNQSIISQ